MLLHACLHSVVPAHLGVFQKSCKEELHFGMVRGTEKRKRSLASQLPLISFLVEVLPHRKLTPYISCSLVDSWESRHHDIYVFSKSKSGGTPVHGSSAHQETESKKGLRDSEKVHNFIAWCLIFLLLFIFFFTKVNTMRYLTLIMLLQIML